MRSLGNLVTLLDDFRKVVALTGVSLPATAVTFEILSAPHKPPLGKVCAKHVFGQFMQTFLSSLQETSRHFSGPAHFAIESQPLPIAITLLAASHLAITKKRLFAYAV